MFTKMLPFLIILYILAASSCRVATLSVDGVALITFKHTLRADPYNVMGNWNVSDDTPCLWSSVICANVPGNTVPRVVGLTVIGKQLSGTIAPALGALDALRRLSLQQNNLSGTLPAQLFNATSLQTILLSGNHIRGSLPPQIGRLLALQTLDISSNSLSGTIPASIMRCVRLQTLVLADNNIAGTIPMGFGRNFTSLEQLDLSANFLSGAIPSDLGELSSLQGTLNLSYNHLSGPIPPTLGKLPYTVSLDLSHNNLSGKIPQDGSLADQGPGPFLGNPELCGFPLDDVCRVSPPIPSLPSEGSSSILSHRKNGGTRKSNLSAGAIVGIAIGDALGISLVAMLLMYWYTRTRGCQEKVSSPTVFNAIKHQRRYGSRKCFNASSEVSSDASGSPEKGREQGELVALDKRFSSDLDELLRSSAYVLGKSGQGIVYKVVLGSGTSVAVRRLGGGGNQRHKEFEIEVQAISKVRHPNVVKLLAYYWADDEKLLIYEYISHGTLASSLHGNPRSPTRVLTWPQRLKILNGAAKGLAHIHECSARKHVHGDIKTSKILLGTGMHAYIADSGLSKLITIAADTGDKITSPKPSGDRSSTPCVSHSSRFYRAPESLAGEVKPSQKWDVYSFGVVMLEVLSGRSPSTQMASAGIDLVAWMRMAVDESKPSEHFLDPAIVPTEEARPPGIWAVYDLAMACTSPNPELRPKMKSVADAIQKLASKLP